MPYGPSVMALNSRGSRSPEGGWLSRFEDADHITAAGGKGDKGLKMGGGVFQGFLPYICRNKQYSLKFQWQIPKALVIQFSS